MMRYKFLVDGQTISRSEVVSLDIMSNCKFSGKKWSINFVGFILKKNITVVSFPKHYIKNNNIENLNEFEIKNYIEILKKLFKKLSKNVQGVFYGDENLNIFPINSYLNVCDYYIRYGIHTNKISEIKKDVYGEIDWNHTLLKSNKLIINNRIVFENFYAKNNQKEDSMITYIMDFVLSDGYISAGEFLNIGIPYQQKFTKKSFESIYMLNILYSYKQKVFKDSEIQLINSLIDYIQWKSHSIDKTKLITSNFNLVWEKLVHNYITKNINTIISLDTDLSEEVSDDENFYFEEKLEQFLPGKRFKVIYDHIGYSRNTILLLDSKYYFDVEKLDYKQYSYHFIIQDNKIFTSQTKTIFNSLIIPTNNSNYIKTHINMSINNIKNNQDQSVNIKISELYLNLYLLIQLYV